MASFPSLAVVARAALLAWVLLEVSNRAGVGPFMGRAPCVCDERTVYVVQATDASRSRSPARRLRRALSLVLPGLLLLLLVEVLVSAKAEAAS